MGFSKKRGRPVIYKEKTDKGTIELRKKRLLNLTDEPLDLCLKKGLISNEQHSAGIRLRWLYTLRYGAAGISAYCAEGKGRTTKYDNDKWMQQRQAEYNIYIAGLNKAGYRTVVMNICIFNQHPLFLLPVNNMLDKKDIERRNIMLLALRNGLDLITKIQ